MKLYEVFTNIEFMADLKANIRFFNEEDIEERWEGAKPKEEINIEHFHMGLIELSEKTGNYVNDNYTFADVLDVVVSHSTVFINCLAIDE